VVAPRRDVVASCEDVGRSELQAGRTRFHAVRGARDAVGDRRRPRCGEGDVGQSAADVVMREMKCEIARSEGRMARSESRILPSESRIARGEARIERSEFQPRLE
jgi:hypothetical protein